MSKSPTKNTVRTHLNNTRMGFERLAMQINLCLEEPSDDNVTEAMALSEDFTDIYDSLIQAVAEYTQHPEYSPNPPDEDTTDEE